MTFIYMIDLQFPGMVFVQPDFKFCLFFQLTLSVFCINNLVPGWGSDERKGELLRLLFGLKCLIGHVRLCCFMESLFGEDVE